MKLLTLQIAPRGIGGLRSELLKFGDHITQLFGPNGSGKTPTVQSIAFCLGYNSVFRDDIYSRCEYAELTFSVGDELFKSSRAFSRDFDLTFESNGRIQHFYSEREFSDHLFQLLDLDADRRLVGMQGEVISPYISTILPLYYLDQDNGYNSFYSPPATFIKDQHSEMMRIAWKLAAKHSFDQKKDSIALRREVDELDKLVGERKKQFEDAKIQLDVDGVVEEELRAELDSLTLQLDGFKSTNQSQSESVEAMGQVVRAKRREVYSIDIELQEIERRLLGQRNIIGEINSEINTLTLNEDARRIFMSFDEICGSDNCGMFLKSSNAFGKNLLYLRDQIKDLDRNSSAEETRKNRYLEKRSRLLAEISDIEQSQVVTSLKTETDALVDAISAVKTRMLEIQLKLGDLKKISVLKTRYLETHDRRERALSTLHELGRESGFSPELIRVRSTFKVALIRWLDILGTSNVNYDISFKQDFVPIFGNEVVGQLKGSTKLRTVLAYHAAFIEQMSISDGTLNIFILDTPKQHDIHNDDLNRYFLELKKLCSTRNVQVVFSSTEYHYEGDSDDAEWNPRFEGKLHPMFYGGTDALPLTEPVP
ncbi:hypothetical protein GTP45_02050 [Pseudoduganella sp. FT55W]|uniref:Uncharacterized protein n=1 Tax=Duganella rivi TaxID=2666083 RepID=A0A7X4GM83_9BURK|nr:hypothetical protein [Duganella rivi]MYM65615.1 hypothetical protein [Duganella rivi]